jgi:type I restriction enzyme S subunit
MKTKNALLLEAVEIVGSQAEPFDGKRQYVATGGLDGGSVVEAQEVEYETKPARANLVAREGDVLFARMQKTNKVILVTKDIENHIWSTGFAALRPRKQLRSRYLLHYLASPLFQVAKDTQCTGSTQKALPNAGLRKLSIPLATLAEQDEAIRTLDAADQLRRLRAMADKRAAGLVSALFHEMFGDPNSPNTAWPIVPLMNMGKVTTGNTPSRKKPEYFGTFMEWVKTDNIDSSRGIVTKAAEGLSKEGVLLGRVVPAGAVLVTCIAGSRPLIGDAARTDRPVAINQQINAITPNPDCDSAFLCEQIRAMKKVIQNRATGIMTGIINKSALESIPVICPPFSLQKQFGVRVAEIRALEAEQANSRRRLDELYNSMLYGAFNGETA